MTPSDSLLFDCARRFRRALDDVTGTVRSGRRIGRRLTNVAGVPSAHTRAALEALFVTVLWSSSYLLIRQGLADIPALTFAGLRYGLAALVLLPLALRRGHHRSIARLPRRDLGLLLVLGVLLYAVTQGAQFVALVHLRAATVSIMLTFTPAIVAVFGIGLLGERPTRRGWLGMLVLFGGVACYFFPFSPAAGHLLGLAVMVAGLLGNALAAVLGRRLNRDAVLPPLGLTTASMGVGAAVLLAVGVSTQGLPALSLSNWLVVGWLAVVNTAFAFTLWNRTLATLSAVESSVINNTMLVQVSLLGWLALGEPLSGFDVLGLALVGCGALVVQLGK